MDEDGPDPEDQRSDTPGGDAIGPAAGVVVGFIAFALARSLPIAARLLIALAVVAIVTFVSLQVTRRRRR